MENKIYNFNDEDFYVNWDSLPEGTTCVCAFSFTRFINGVPLDSENCEKWIPMKKYNKPNGHFKIMEFSNNKWIKYTRTNLDQDVFPKTRLLNPKYKDLFYDPFGFFL